MLDPHVEFTLRVLRCLRICKTCPLFWCWCHSTRCKFAGLWPGTFILEAYENRPAVGHCTLDANLYRHCRFILDKYKLEDSAATTPLKY
jgi:hypothetical protein